MQSKQLIAYLTELTSTIFVWPMQPHIIKPIFELLQFCMILTTRSVELLQPPHKPRFQCMEWNESNPHSWMFLFELGKINVRKSRKFNFHPRLKRLVDLDSLRCPSTYR
jgi:hypothetical protein